MAPIFIPRIQRNFDEDDEKNGPMLRPLLRRSFSFSVFSYDVHFQSAPSPMAHIFITRLLLRRLFSFRAFS
jgi:hypothetical protein